MPTADVQRLITGVANAPATFTVPGNGQIQPKAIFAHYDGTGAGVAFLPVLKITSDAGQFVGIYPLGQTVAAGASAECSWFPRVNGNRVSVTDGVTTVQAAQSVDFTSGATVTDGGNGIADVAIAGFTSPLTTKGDVYGHSTVDARIPVGADNTVLTAASAQALGVQWAAVGSLSGGRPNVQVFGAGVGSWTKPAGTTAVDVLCIGAGGGGSGGCSANGGVNATGGAGGGGGAVTRVVMQAADVSSPQTVTVGAGGTGGAGGAAVNNVGVKGNDGAQTTFGTLLKAGGGGGGAAQATTSTDSVSGGGGSVINSATGVSGGVPTTATAGLSGQSGQVAGSGGIAGISTEFGGASGGGSHAGATGRQGGSSIFGGPGGASGGASGTNAGGVGGTTQSYSAGGGAAGGAVNTGNPGSDGTSFLGPYCGGGGGGGGGTGGGAVLNTPGGNGGKGGIGAGGGGGGAFLHATNLQAGGNGGNGGDGRCVVISW